MLEIEAQKLVSRTGAYSEAQDYHVVPSPTEWWRNARKRATPQGLAVATIVSQASWPFNLSVNSALSPRIHEIGWDNPEMVLLKFATIGLLGIAATQSVKLETRAFREMKYSISPPGTILYSGTGKARLASIVEHIGDHILLSFANPFFEAGLVHNDPRLMVDSVIATSLSLSTWSIFWNRSIMKGTVDRNIDRLRTAGNWISNKTIGTIDEKASGFTIASAGNLTPGVWVELPRKNDGDQEKPLL